MNRNEILAICHDYLFKLQDTFDRIVKELSKGNFKYTEACGLTEKLNRVTHKIQAVEYLIEDLGAIRHE